MTQATSAAAFISSTSHLLSLSLFSFLQNQNFYKHLSRNVKFDPIQSSSILFRIILKDFYFWKVGQRRKKETSFETSGRFSGIRVRCKQLTSKGRERKNVLRINDCINWDQFFNFETFWNAHFSLNNKHAPNSRVKIRRKCFDKNYFRLSYKKWFYIWIYKW